MQASIVSNHYKSRSKGIYTDRYITRLLVV